MTPFFSVVIPVHNRADDLARALRSVLAQTERDFEIVVVDDGSIDNPKKTVEHAGDSRVRYWRQDNRGGGAARNAGIDLARGRFVAFLDSDDQFLPIHLASMRKLLAHTSRVAGYAPVRVERGGELSFVKPPRAIRDGEHMASYVLCDRGFVPTITLVVPTEMARRVRYDENVPFAQDTDFCIRLFLAGCRFVMADQPGAVWNDVRDPRRISAGRKGARMVAWLEKLKPEIPARAYYGARGWMIAKGLARTDPMSALKLFADAVCRGCYRPRMAAVIFLQIFFPDPLYRKLADAVIGWSRGAVWSHSARAVKP
jgi:glycosyltransferase involved in cell wall biosynthesis